MNPIRILYIKLVLATLFFLVLPVVLLAGPPEDVSGLIKETRAKVTGVGAGFVFVDDVALGQLVQHGAHFRKHFCGFLRVGGGTQIADSIPSRLVIVPVASSLLFVRADALQR